MAGKTEAWGCYRSKVLSKRPRVRQTLDKLLRNCDKHPHSISSKSSVRTQRAPQTKGTQLTVKCYVYVREHPFQEAGEDGSVGLD